MDGLPQTIMEQESAGRGCSDAGGSTHGGLESDSKASAAGRDPRGNALKHGLCATTLLPQVLGAEHYGEIRRRFVAEYQPRTATEELLVAEIARHAAVLEITEQAEPAVMRQAAATIEKLVEFEAHADQDLRLAAAVTGEPLDRCARYRRGHEKAMYQALEKLRLVRAQPLDIGPSSEGAASRSFATAEDCEQYLKAHLFSSQWRCPDCNSPTGHWMDSRKLWQCAHCDRQIGIRYGAVFERSRLPLPVWFNAIRYFAAETDIRASELAPLLEIKRVATVQTMLQRIQRALANDDTQSGLAGLLRYPLARPPGAKRRKTPGSASGETTRP